MEFIRYANQGAVRSLPLSERLVSALSFLPELGVTMEVFSGGQPAPGEGPRVGSTRHDHGNAADVFFYDRSGRRLDWANEQDRPIFEEIVRRARANGVTGFGAGEGYMRPGSMHIGFGSEAVWGAGGSGENAPGWLRAAYHGAHPGHDGAPTNALAASAPGHPPQNALAAPEQAIRPPQLVDNRLDPRAFMTAQPINALSYNFGGTYGA